MSRSYRWAHALDVRKPMPTAAVLLVLLAQVTACQPDSEPEPGDTTPEPQAQTAPFSLTAASRDPGTGPELPPGSDAYLAVLTKASMLSSPFFRYDAYVVTARESGAVRIQADVVEESNPSGYRYGYGYPLSMTAIQEGVSLVASSTYVQNALDTGTAIIEDSVVAGHQYILVYKSFDQFTPLTYRLTLPSSLIIEGRIYEPPAPVPVPPHSAGLITLENPRPDMVSSFVPRLSDQVGQN